MGKPLVSKWILDLYLWRREQDVGLSELPITEWMADMLADEFGCVPKEIDGVKLRVVPDSWHLGIKESLC